MTKRLIYVLVAALLLLSSCLQQEKTISYSDFSDIKSEVGIICEEYGYNYRIEDAITTIFCYIEKEPGVSYSEAYEAYKMIKNHLAQLQKDLYKLEREIDKYSR